MKADAQAGQGRTDRTKYLAAKAQLALAAPARDAFRSVQLTQPLKKSLITKKKAMEAAVAGYKGAAAYEVAEVVTASTYEIAELYRQLAKDVMKSERPKKLTKEEREQYDLLLEEQAFPFEEQAIAIHEQNVARAREGLYDDSVKKSYAALRELKPGRYGKTELVQDVFTSLTSAAVALVVLTTACRFVPYAEKPPSDAAVAAASQSPPAAAPAKGDAKNATAVPAATKPGAPAAAKRVRPRPMRRRPRLSPRHRHLRLRRAPSLISSAPSA